jgi:PAS domain S-box-containing protein
MTSSETLLSYLRDPRLASHATDAAPVWLWASDASRVLWANAAGAAVLGEASPRALSERRFHPNHPAAREVTRIVGALPDSGANGSPHLDKLGWGTPILCCCESVQVAGGPAGVLIAGAEPAGPTLSLAERARRLLSETEGSAVLAPDGTLLHAGREAAVRLEGCACLGMLGLNALIAEALTCGLARSRIAGSELVLTRLGMGDTTALLATFQPPAPAGEGDPSPSAAEQEPGARRLDEGAVGDATGTPATGPADFTGLVSRLVARGHPLRFMWRMDTEGRFVIESDEFLALAGPRTAALLGRPWSDVAVALTLDPEGSIARAVASRDTWSGITVHWPVDAAGTRLPVLLSGLPVCGPDRAFEGYRGFGVCRDVEGLAGALAPSLPDEERTSEAPQAAASAEQAGCGEDAEPGQPAPQSLPEGETAEYAEGPRAGESRPQLTLVPTAKNVVPFRSAAPLPADRRPALTSVERSAFQEIARALGAGLEGEQQRSAEHAAPQSEASAAEPLAALMPGDNALGQHPILPSSVPGERTVLDRMPTAVLVYRADALLYANRTFFEWTGFGDLAALAEAGGVGRLFPDPAMNQPGEPDAAERAISLVTRAGDALPVEARLFSLTWEGEPALALMVSKSAADTRRSEAALALHAAQAETRELASILEVATDGVIVLDAEGHVLALNRRAEALFGYAQHELAGRPFSELVAPESCPDALECLDGFAGAGFVSIADEGRVFGRTREGGRVPLLMSMGRIAEDPAKFCAVFRDITPWKRGEEELLEAKRKAEQASLASSGLLARLNHDVRTPLNTIMGFSEMMLEQPLDPANQGRYREYLNAIHASGQHLMAVLGEMLDLSQIEAGGLDLTFARLDLNDVTQQAVAVTQPQASRERIIIRTAFSTAVPPIVADALSVRQIVLDLLSSSIKRTGAGGQVIVSTALTDLGEAVLRVRDTGTETEGKDLAAEVDPLRSLAPANPWRAGAATGLGLSLTAALVKANRASVRIKSAVGSGTLVEILFASTPMPAQ